VSFKVLEYAEHTLSEGRDAKAIAYFGISMGTEVYYGAGWGENISYASVNALVSALNVANRAEFSMVD